MKGFLTEDEDEERLYELNNDPLLYVDINFGGNDKRRIALYEKSNPERVATLFVEANGLDKIVIGNLAAMLA